MSKLKSILAGLLLATSVQAETLNDSQYWLDIPIDINFKDSKWIGYLENQNNLTNNFNNLNQVMLRAAIGYKFNEHWIVYQGYTVQADEFGTSNRYGMEQDTYQEIDYKNKAMNGNLHWSIRHRLDEQFIPGNSNMSLRLRSRIKAEYIIPKYTDWSLIASEEIFNNLNDVTNNPQAKVGVQQNRVTLGVGHQVSKNLQLELDYINVYEPGYSGAPNQKADVIQTSFNFEF